MPVVTFVVYLFTTKITKKFTYQPLTNEDQAAGCSGKVMEYSLPLMSTFFTFLFPAAIGIYWIFKSFSGLAKQAILSFAMPIPKFTEEDYKAAEKKIRETNTAPRPIRPGVRKSLHRIDEYDDEVSAPQKALPDASDKNREPEKSEKTAAPLETAPLKKDPDRKTRNKDKKKER